MEDKTWQARAAAWELLALSLRYPDKVLVEAIARGEWEEAAAEIAMELGIDGPPAPIRPPAPAGCALLRTLRVEATRLFVGAPEPAVSPYEGVWRAEQEGARTLLFVNPYSVDVERFARSCGLARPEGVYEPLDHASTECELLSYLASLAVGAPAPAGAPDGTALPGGSPQAAYDVFLDSHARMWMPAFAEAVRAESRHSFYVAAACLLAGVIARG